MIQDELDKINTDYACRALLGDGKGQFVMEELKKGNPAYYERIMGEARKELEARNVKLPGL